MIVMCFNDKSPYVEQARVAIKSIKLNSPNIDIIVYIVNSTTLFFDGVICKHRGLSDIKSITAYSLVVMYETLFKYKKPILWLDVDVLVRKSTNLIFNNILANTLMVLKRPINKERSIFNTGVVGVGYSHITLDMIKWSFEKAMENKEWYADQLYLYKGYLKYSKNINLINLINHREWHDIGGKSGAFNKNSVIWHCKKSHFDNPIYQNEYKYYRNMVYEDTI